MRTISEEAAAVNDVGFAIDDGLEQHGVFSGVVFEVGVLDDDDVACDVCKSGAECSTFAFVDFVVLK